MLRLQASLNSIGIFWSNTIMSGVERPGVDKKWSKQWKSTLRSLSEWAATVRAVDRNQMQYYIAHGYTEFSKEFAHLFADVVPQIQDWEQLNAEFSMHALICAFDFEAGGMQEKFDLSYAQHAFAAAYHGEMILLQLHRLSSERNGNVLRTLNYDKLAFTALGVTIGCKERAFRLVRMQLAAYRKGYYLDNRHYPIYQFILRILADYLNEPPHVLAGESLDEPIFNTLFSLWRTTDIEALTPACLAACDYHTHRCRSDNAENFYEFETGHWSRTPIEILLLFRLRQYMGLQIPDLDHPLMNSSLGALHPEVSFEPDELTSRVLERMREDGYDDEKIYSDFMRN